MKISFVAFRILKIAIDPALVNSVELTLKVVEVGFTQRPSVSQTESLKLVSYIGEPIICLFEALIDFALSAYVRPGSYSF